MDGWRRRRVFARRLKPPG